MRRIVGYVLVKETLTGIPQLVVTAYDGNLSLDDLRRQRPTAALMQKLGRRISSVLTGDDGQFVLTSDDLEFTGNEPRPDLALVVYAPEDVVDRTHPYPDPPEQRVLYMSVVSRVDAGAQEAFVIRLSEEQIRRFQIDARPNRMAIAVERAWQFGESLHGRLSDRYARERERAGKRRKLVREKLKNLSAVPRERRNDSLLVFGKRDLSERAPTLQRTAIEEGLVRLAKQPYPQATLYLDSSQLGSIGLTEENGKLIGAITPEQFSAALRKSSADTALTRVKGLSNPSPDTLEAKYLHADAALPTSASKPLPPASQSRSPGKKKTASKGPANRSPSSRGR